MFFWVLSAGIVVVPANAEERHSVSWLRGPYNFAQYGRQRTAYQRSAALHYYHARQHDVLQLTPLVEHTRVDAEFEADVVNFTEELPAKIEPTQEYYGPYTARMAWKLYRAIDWTHQLHEQTYDILADADIPWPEKKRWTDRSVKYYLEKNQTGIPRSVAPLDITMRRAAVMMKPYFTYYRNYYPRSSLYAFSAHWWHPAIYDAQLLGGQGPEQDRMVRETDQVFMAQVLEDRPERMLLSREIMPRYSRFSPEAANAFDNLHMLHGIAYDILAYEGWTPEQKQAELYRVIEAMSYQPGDEQLARKFPLPHPDHDPRAYTPWVKSPEGEMNRIMMEMMEEMMPMMMPAGKEMTTEQHKTMMEQFKMKMRAGLEQGEIEGSLHDAMMAVMPDLKMEPDSMKPGATPEKMVETMLRGWNEKYAAMADVEPWLMEAEPVPPEPLVLEGEKS